MEFALLGTGMPCSGGACGMRLSVGSHSPPDLPALPGLMQYACQRLADQCMPSASMDYLSEDEARAAALLQGDHLNQHSFSQKGLPKRKQPGM